MKYAISMLLAIAGGASAFQEEDANQKELDKLQGKWLVVAMERDGRKAPKETCDSLIITIAGDKTNRDITLPSYIRSVKKVQVWCSFAEELVIASAAFLTFSTYEPIRGGKHESCHDGSVWQISTLADAERIQR